MIGFDPESEVTVKYVRDGQSEASPSTLNAPNR